MRGCGLALATSAQIQMFILIHFTNLRAAKNAAKQRMTKYHPQKSLSNNSIKKTYTVEALRGNTRNRTVLPTVALSLPCLNSHTLCIYVLVLIIIKFFLHHRHFILLQWYFLWFRVSG